ncbi:hypothetical protein DEJ43_02650 [Streptomyces venezuelae ATCC 10712]|nr:hypothetical protein vnz_02625 [Streptomyces venezuelae]QER97406.1 hypothetical protein DEJ43_02650 [Streptomyces venezuelae ATCC 10712]
MIAMHPRRTTFLLLSVLLTAGCVAVPHPTAPRPQPGPRELAPAAERPPTPLPAPPAPTPPVPYEELAVTDPGSQGRPTPGLKRAGDDRRTGGTAAPRPAGPASRHRGPQPGKAAKAAKPAVRAVPRPPAEPPRRAARPRTRPVPQPPTPHPTTARPPAMRQLCRQAQDIDAPMGAAELCRGVYGR